MTRKQINDLQYTYFNIIRKDPYLEMQSICTGHCWIIRWHRPGIAPKNVTLYHKHKITDYYHTHAYYYTEEQAIRQILSHDKYVLSKKSNQKRHSIA